MSAGVISDLVQSVRSQHPRTGSTPDDWHSRIFDLVYLTTTADSRLIVRIGNPGRRRIATRHLSAGTRFSAVRRMVEEHAHRRAISNFAGPGGQGVAMPHWPRRLPRWVAVRRMFAGHRWEAGSRSGIWRSDARIGAAAGNAAAGSSSAGLEGGAEWRALRGKQ